VTRGDYSSISTRVDAALRGVITTQDDCLPSIEGEDQLLPATHAANDGHVLIAEAFLRPGEGLHLNVHAVPVAPETGRLDGAAAAVSPASITWAFAACV